MKDTIQTTIQQTAEKNYEDLQTCFKSGSTKSLKWRKSQLQALRKGLKEMEGSFVKALSLDMGKVEPLTIAEIGQCINDCYQSFYSLDDWAKNEYIPTNLELLPSKSWRQPAPLGVALIIGAWNFPISLTIQPLVGAIAAGCCALVKPSENCPNTARLIYEIVEKYLDTAAYRTMLGGKEVVSVLLDEFRWDKMFFTGGVNVGKKVAAAAAKNLTDVTLELGGKNPVVIDKEVNLKSAVSRLLWGKMENAGQFCLSPDFCVVHEDIYERFVDEIKALYSKNWGDPSKAETVGKMPVRIVNKRRWRYLHAMIDEVENSQTSSVLLGGTKLASEEQLFIPLTIVVNVPKSLTIMTEEIFGPILPVVVVKSIDDAISFVNDMPRKHPLATYIFTSNQATATKFL